jgi:hypothetical protein
LQRATGTSARADPGADGGSFGGATSVVVPDHPAGDATQHGTSQRFRAEELRLDREDRGAGDQRQQERFHNFAGRDAEATLLFSLDVYR